MTSQNDYFSWILKVKCILFKILCAGMYYNANSGTVNWVSAVILYWSFSSISNLAIPSENQNLNILQEITRLTVSTLNLMFFQIFAAKVVLQYFNLCSIIFLIILMFQKH